MLAREDNFVKILKKDSSLFSYFRKKDKFHSSKSFSSWSLVLANLVLVSSKEFMINNFSYFFSNLVMLIKDKSNMTFQAKKKRFR